MPVLTAQSQLLLSSCWRLPWPLPAVPAGRDRREGRVCRVTPRGTGSLRAGCSQRARILVSLSSPRRLAKPLRSQSPGRWLVGGPQNLCSLDPKQCGGGRAENNIGKLPAPLTLSVKGAERVWGPLGGTEHSALTVAGRVVQGQASWERCGVPGAWARAAWVQVRRWLSHSLCGLKQAPQPLCASENFI